uniref:DDE-1 domain-containing protein n=1 Tax=Amphimedon queenslandica TaxID=400682 RepID=A0A1X7TZ92_AMPQE
METIKLLYLLGLKTVVICDGASSNLATIKASHGASGVYQLNRDKSDPYEVHPSFVNPYDPPNLMHWMICPTHQLKNNYDTCSLFFKKWRYQMLYP